MKARMGISRHSAVGHHGPNPAALATEGSETDSVVFSMLTYTKMKEKSEYASKQYRTIVTEQFLPDLNLINNVCCCNQV